MVIKQIDLEISKLKHLISLKVERGSLSRACSRPSPSLCLESLFKTQLHVNVFDAKYTNIRWL